MARSNSSSTKNATTANNNNNTINGNEDDEILQSRLKKPSHMQQRQSVRSLSEMPNIIGMHAIGHKTNKDVCSILLIILTWSLVFCFFPLSFIFIFRVIQEYERGKTKIFSICF